MSCATTGKSGSNKKFSSLFSHPSFFYFFRVDFNFLFVLMPRHRTCAVLTCKLDPDPRCKGYCFKHRLDRRPLLQIFGVQKRPPPTVHRRTKSSGKQWSSMLRSPTPTGRQLHYEYKRNSSPRRKQRSSSRESSSGSGSGRRRSSGSRKYVSTRSKSEVRGRRNGTRGQHQQQPKRSSNHETKGGSRRRGRSRGKQMLIEVGKRPKRSNRSRSAVAQRSGQRGRRGRRTEERKQTRRISPPPSPPISPVAVYSSDEEVDVPSPPPWPPGGVRFSKYESEHRLFHIEDEPEKIQNATPVKVNL